MGLELLDTPGVLWPKFDDPEIGFCLAVTGAIKEDVFDREQAVMLLLERLKTNYSKEISEKYGIEILETDSVEGISRKIAAARGCLKTGGVPDIEKVIQLVLRDFRTGRLGSFTLDKPDRK